MFEKRQQKKPQQWIFDEKPQISINGAVHAATLNKNKVNLRNVNSNLVTSKTTVAKCQQRNIMSEGQLKGQSLKEDAALKPKKRRDEERMAMTALNVEKNLTKKQL